jgi:hypothetical protein
MKRKATIVEAVLTVKTFASITWSEKKRKIENEQSKE